VIMKKALIILLAAVLFFFIFFKFTGAAPAGGLRAFGGKIINEEARRLTTLEASGWSCAVPGDTFDILPVFGSAGSYLVPPGVLARGGGAPSPGKKVLGLYSLTRTPITCTFPDPPATQIVYVYPITIFGLTKL